MWRCSNHLFGVPFETESLNGLEIRSVLSHIRHSSADKLHVSEKFFLVCLLVVTVVIVVFVVLVFTRVAGDCDYSLPGVCGNLLPSSP